jgi:hypothetical protein
VNPLLKSFAEQTAGFLVSNHGFDVKGTRYLRQDRLMRSVWFVESKATTDDAVAFDVVLDLGIPGVSSFAPRIQKWVVRASTYQVYIRHVSPAVRFELRNVGWDSRLEEAVRSTLIRLCSEFLLNFETEYELYDFVKTNAIEFKEL